MHAIIFDKNKPFNPISICDIHNIHVHLWGLIIINMCVLIVETENLVIPRVILTVDLLDSKTINVDDIQSNIITQINEITNT